MGTCAEMLRRIQATNLQDIAGDIIQGKEDAIIQINKDQLMQGLNNKGVLLSPKHSENPWFKKPGAGLRYAEWKKRLFPETPFDVPNLIVIGVYHRSMTAIRNGNVVTFGATADFAPNIDLTFNNTALGLNEDGLNRAWLEIVKPPLLRIVATKIGCSVSK